MCLLYLNRDLLKITLFRNIGHNSKTGVLTSTSVVRKQNSHKTPTCLAVLMAVGSCIMTGYFSIDIMLL